MAAGGAGVAGAGFGVSGTKPRRQFYGGNEEQFGALQQQYGTGIQSGLGQQETGQGLMSLGVSQAGRIGEQGRGLMDQANRQAAGNYAAISSIGDAYGDARAQMMGIAGQDNMTYLRAATERANAAMRSQAAAARGGNQAAAMRNAQAQAASNYQQAGQQAQLMKQQQQIAAMQGLAQLGQAQAGTQAQLVGQTMNQQQGLMGLGMQAQQYGAGQALGAGQGLMSLGAGREGMYLDAQQGMYGMQLNADTKYDIARAEAQQSKRNGLIALGSSLMGGGANVMTGKGWNS